MKVIECSQRGVGNEHTRGWHCPSCASEMFLCIGELYRRLTRAISCLIDHWQELKRQMICRTANPTKIKLSAGRTINIFRGKVLRWSTANSGHETQPAWPLHLNDRQSSQNKPHTILVHRISECPHKIKVTILIIKQRICFHVISPSWNG